jgi:hypothetical protein
MNFELVFLDNITLYLSNPIKKIHHIVKSSSLKELKEAGSAYPTSLSISNQIVNSLSYAEDSL